MASIDAGKENNINWHNVVCDSKERYGNKAVEK